MKKLNADSPKSLKDEREALADMAHALEAGRVQLNMRPGSDRRKMLSSILRIACNPKRRNVHPDLLAAAQALCSYNDKLARLILEAAQGEFDTWIKESRERRKLDRAVEA